MALFRNIGFENFRVFKKATFLDFAPITVLTGTNNSGKSTLLNGLKLLKDNFSHIKPKKLTSESIDLAEIFNSVIRPGKLLERYGDIKQFITSDSGRNEFSFYFTNPMESIEDIAVVKIYIGINENTIKTGRIKSIEIHSTNENKIIFQVTENKGFETSDEGIIFDKPETHFIKTDFTYFTNAFRKNLRKSFDCYKDLENLSQLINTHTSVIVTKELDTALKIFSKKYSMPCYISENELKNGLRLRISHEDIPGYLILDTQLAEIDNPAIYDFSFIWKDNPENKILFMNKVLSYYNVSFDESMLALTNDIQKFLSDLEWETNVKASNVNSRFNMDSILKDTTGLIGLRKCIELYAFFSDRQFINRLRKKSQGVNIDEDQLASAIEKNEDFFEKVFKPLLYILKNPLKDPKDLLGEMTNSYKSLMDQYTVSESEKIIGQMAYQNISLIRSWIASVSDLNFLPGERIANKRLHSLSDMNEFADLIRGIEELASEEKIQAYEFISTWVSNFQIAERFFVKFDDKTGSFIPYLLCGGKEILLADFGYGTSQLLPLILKLIPHNVYNVYENEEYMFRLVAIEEPEANLHPALQSLLADLFAEAMMKFNIQLVIETHSEYLIRKLQFLTAKKKLRPWHSQIYYFYNPTKIPQGENQIKKINIQEDGSLTDNFGEGFYDEATSWKFELLKLNNPQKN